MGAFYENKTENWEYRAITPEFLTTLSYYSWLYSYAPSGVDPSWWLSVDDTEWDQYAVFGNFSYDFNDQWSAEVGLRYFDLEQDRTYFVDKPFIISPSWPDVVTPQGGNEDVVPKISVTHRFDDERMMYVLYSEGFRPGGANRNRVPEELTVLPLSYDPDKLKNFEVGAKTRWADGRIQLNVTAFFMQWEDYQIETIDPSFQPCGPGQSSATDPCDQNFQVLVANVGDAEQLGIEADLRGLIGDNFDYGVNATYVDARTAETFEVTTVVQKGTKLPNVPNLKLNVYGQWNWPVNFVNDGSIYARLQMTHQSDSRTQLEFFPEAPPGVQSTPTRVQDAYTILDAKIGLVGSNWELQGFVNNITDERAEIYNDVFFHDTFFGRDRLTTNRPIEYGVRLRMDWGGE